MKIIYFSSLISILFFPADLLSQVNLQQGLIAYYNLDNNLLDSTSNNLDLTSSGSPVAGPDRFGNLTGAYILHSSTFDNFTAPLDPLLGPAELSVSVWVNLPNTFNDQKVAGRATVNGGGYLMGVDSNKLDAEIWDLNNVHFRLKSGNISPNTWTHLVMTFKGSDYLKIYINGIIVDSIPSGSVGAGVSSFWTFTVGGAPWQPTALNLNGSIDDIYVYGRAINSDEVLALQSITTNISGVTATNISASVYPVPTIDKKVSVDFPQTTSGAATIRIFDSTGKLLFDKEYLNPQKEVISLFDFNAGVYYLAIFRDDLNESFKLIVK